MGMGYGMGHHHHGGKKFRKKQKKMYKKAHKHGHWWRWDSFAGMLRLGTRRFCSSCSFVCSLKILIVSLIWSPTNLHIGLPGGLSCKFCVCWIAAWGWPAYTSHCWNWMIEYESVKTDDKERSRHNKQLMNEMLSLKTPSDCSDARHHWRNCKVLEEMSKNKDTVESLCVPVLDINVEMLHMQSGQCRLDLDSLSEVCCQVLEKFDHIHAASWT